MTNTGAVFRPMLAYDAPLEYYGKLAESGEQLVASNKLDGIRAVVLGGQLLSRTLKPIPNKYVREMFSDPSLEGFDGELIVGAPNGEGVFGRCASGIMSQGGTPKVTYHVFDLISEPRLTYHQRYARLIGRLIDLGGQLNSEISRIELVSQKAFDNTAELERIEQAAIEEGYEGLIIRKVDAPYKFGRSTKREGYLGKLKRFLDREAVITGFEELMHNDNPAQRDIRGFSVRSSHLANQRASGMLGALQVRDVLRNEWVFNIGTGFDHETRILIWNNRGRYLGKTIRYTYLPIGTLDVPRHPVFQGFRHPEDM